MIVETYETLEEFIDNYDFGNFWEKAFRLNEIMEHIKNGIPKKEIIRAGFTKEEIKEAKMQIRLEKSFDN